jgi:hypothetical protein
MALSMSPLLLATGQVTGYTAMIPTFHARPISSGRENPVQLQRQRFIVFVYRNAVAVGSAADFVNTGQVTVSQEIALPSTGHDENGSEPGGRLSNGLLSVHMWVEGQRILPEVIHDGSEDWYAIQVGFPAGERRRVEAVFWAQTSLEDVDALPGLDTAAIAPGRRGFMLDLAHAAVWDAAIDAIDVTVVLEGGLSIERDSISAEPRSYDLQDSTLTWSFRNIEPSLDDNIVLAYTPSGSWGTATMAGLSRYIVGKVYDKMLQHMKRRDEE